MEKLMQITYSLNDAAKLLNISRPTMLQLARRDDFPAFRIGRRWVINGEALQRWLDAQVEAKPQTCTDEAC